MTYNKIAQTANSVAPNVIGDIIRSYPHLTHHVHAAWERNGHAIVQQIINGRAGNPPTVGSISSFMSQELVSIADNYAKSQSQPHTLAQPSHRTNPYGPPIAHTPPPTQTSNFFQPSSQGMSHQMSPNVLNAANQGYASNQAYQGYNPTPQTPYRPYVTDSEMANRKAQEAQNRDLEKQRIYEKRTIVPLKYDDDGKIQSESVNNVSVSEEEIDEVLEQTHTKVVPTPELKELKISQALREIKMLEAKDCTKSLDIKFESEKDSISRLIYASEGRKIATLYTGTLKSMGFKSPFAARQYVEDNILTALDDMFYTHVEYLELTPLLINNPEGTRLFNLIYKELNSDDNMSALDAFTKIQTILNSGTRLAGDGIDKFIISLVNEYTRIGFIESYGEYSEIEFDSITDILNILGPNKPSKYLGLWSDNDYKRRIEILACLVLRMLRSLESFSIDNSGDIEQIMSCIGSVVTDEGVMLSSIKDMLPVARTKEAREEIQSNECYGEIKKYTVVAVPKYLVYSNYIEGVLEEEDYNPDVLLIDSNEATSCFEYFLANHGTSELTNIIFKYNNGTYMLFKMHITDSATRLVPIE